MYPAYNAQHRGHTYKCDVCDTSFNQAGSLKNHKMIPTGKETIMLK